MKIINHLPDLLLEYETKIGRPVQQKEIAIASDIPEGTFSRYINGRVGSLSLDIEYRLCQFFSKKLERPIDRSDIMSFEFDDAS